MVNKYLHLSPEVERGIALINRGAYYQAHEVLEFAWRADGSEIRRLYQGLVQVSVMLYHLERNNMKGVHKLLLMAMANIAPFSGYSSRLNIPQLLRDLTTLAGRFKNNGEPDPAFQKYRLLLHLQDELPEG